VQTVPKLTLTLVDGFAGGGEYLSEMAESVDGTPPLMMRATHLARASLNVGRRTPREVDAEFFFVEKRQESAEYLRRHLERRRAEGVITDMDFQRATVRNASFLDELPKIVDRIKERRGGGRAIFLLDQYSYNAIPMSKLRWLMWAHSMRSWYSASQSRPGKVPRRRTDKGEAAELESLLKRTEVCLQQMAARQYGPSTEEQRQRRLDIAKADTLRLASENLKLKAMFADAQAKLAEAEYRNQDLSACVSAAMAALAPTLDDQAEQTEQPLVAVQEKAYLLMRQTYDADIDRVLASKKLLDDPRKDTKLWGGPLRSWYPAASRA
jgi:three-Cys-motif partner protein